MPPALSPIRRQGLLRVRPSGFLQLLCWLLFALPACMPAQQYMFDSYQQAQGLGNLFVQDIAFDKGGFLWVATANGLFRLLGPRFEHYGPEQGLKERNVQEVYIDPQGRVWAATVGDLYVWDGSRFSSVGGKPVPMWMRHRMVVPAFNRLLAISEDQLLDIALDARARQLSQRPYFSKEQRKAFPELDALHSIMMAPDGTLWLGCGVGICSYRDGNLRVWAPKAGVRPGTWISFHSDHRGSLWAASQGHVAELPAGSSRFVDRTPPGVGLGGVFYWAPVLEDRQGRILVSAEAGLSRWDGAAWQAIGPGNGLTPRRVTGLALDGNGDPWVGSVTGVAHWTGYEHWEGWTAQQGLPSSTVWSFGVGDPGQVLIGTVKGPARLDIRRQRIDLLTGGGPWIYGQVGGMAQDKRGRVWASTFGGSLLCITGTHQADPDSSDSKAVHVSRVAKLDAFVHRIMLAPDGRLWVLSNQGIDVIDTTISAPVVRHLAGPDALSGDKGNDVVAMSDWPPDALPGAASRSGRSNVSHDLWFLTTNGLIRLDEGAWTKPSIRGLSDGLSNQEATLMEIGRAPDGSLWAFGEDADQHAGVWHILPLGAGFHAVRLRVPANLRDLLPFSLLVDRRGWLWLGTDLGLAAWNGSSWRHFNQESGLVWNDANRGVLSEAPDGSIWIGTSGGAGHLLHPESAFDPVPLSVAITSVQHGDRSSQAGEALSMPWADSRVRFRFASPATWNRSSLVFSYRIAGLASAWTATQDTEAAFPGLPPGQYRFEVFVYDPETATTSPMVGSAFRILPPWWRTAWFYGLCVVAAALLLWLLSELQTRRLIQHQQELERLVAERTQELESSREAFRVQATHDALTGLLNRGAIVAKLEQEMVRARREGAMLAVLLADIDFFKRVNDIYGHAAGDAVLRRFADGLTQGTRSYDFVGRYGGEEFLMLLCNLTQETVGERLSGLHSVVSNLRALFEGHEFTVTCSIGVSFLAPGDATTDANQLLSAADAALYEAKRAGRNRIVLAEGPRAGGLATIQ